MKLTEIALEDAVGLRLAHDMTRIDAALGTKGARFKKGQIVTPEDLPVLRGMGREHLSILELEPDEIHEDDAARELCGAIIGLNCSSSLPSEGLIGISADCCGLLCYDPEMVHRVNEDPDWVLATMPPHSIVAEGQRVAGFRIRPLAMERHRVRRAAGVAGRIDVMPFRPLTAGLLTTGREIATGLVRDAFADKFRGKLSSFGGIFAGQRFSSDDSEQIAAEIRAFIEGGADLVVCTGGMSVDADDRTPGGIRLVAEKISFQGVPMLPGAMLMLGSAKSPSGGEVSILGAPACVVHDVRTSLDCVLPFIFAGVDPTPFMRRRGVGGLCEHCSPCHWPECRFSSGC
ncbi:MAG: molybdopterin-binding protein [Synergistaceae bacterium]|jgi:hypothetical protein|nr:molybdopterin-binding protein [Synergistaceae bacterium]